MVQANLRFSLASIRGRFYTWMCGTVAAALLAASSPARADFPTPNLTSLFPQGGKQGASFEVTIGGADLDSATQLLFSHPGITSAPKMGEPEDGKPAAPVANVFTVTVKPDVPPGIYECRAVGRYGVSNPRAFQVGTLPEVTNDGANKTIAKAIDLLPGATVNGKIDPESAQYFKLPLKAGQRMLLDCYANRLDSRLNGTLTVFDANRRELARVRDTEGRDPILDFTAPAEGVYTIALGDFLFGGGPEYPYRLTVNAGPRIDAIFPPSGVAGASGQFTVYGRNLPGGQPAAGFTLYGRPVEQLTVNIAVPGDDASTSRFNFGSLAMPYSSALDGFAWQLPSPQGVSNALTVYYASGPVVLEQEPNDESAKAQKLTLPCEFVGRFGPRSDRDWVEFEIPAGERYTAEVISHRLGLDTDPALTLYKVSKNEKGEEKLDEVQQVDDGSEAQRDRGDGNRNRAFELSSDDPVLAIKPADKNTTYRLSVRNQFADGNNDPRRVYRLCLRRDAGDFRLVATPILIVNQQDNNKTAMAPFVLRQGGATVVNVRAFRGEGFNGEIQVSAEGLPAGVTCAGAIMGGGVESVPLVFTAGEGTAASVAPVRILGKATVNGKELVREARMVTMVWPASTNQQGPPMVTRMARDMALAVVEKEQSPASVQAGDGNLIETAPGGKIEVALKVARRAGFTEAFKLATLGVPETIKPQGEINIAAGAADGKMEIALTNPQMKPGTYTFCLRGDAKFKYERDPEALKLAETEKQEVDQKAKEMSDKAKQAADAKTKSAALATECATKVKQAQDAKQAADKAKQAADEKLKQAIDKLVAAKLAAATDGADQAKKDAAAAAEKESAEADAAAKQAVAKIAEVDKALADALAAAKAAEEEKANTEKAAADAEQKQKKIEDKKKTLETKVQELKKNAGPKDNTALLVSTPIRVRINPSPLTLAPVAAPGPVKQNEKLELPVTIARLFGYAEGVEVTLEGPEGMSGLSAPKIDIPKDQTAGKLTLSAGGNVPPGEYKVTIRAKAKWNNVPSEVKQELLVKVEEAPKK